MLLAVIGKHWVTAKKATSDIRRIDDPYDYLRVEIVTALKNDSVLVIPILVGDATMPTAEELPEELVPLSYRNGFELRDSRWESDVTLLIRSIEKACGEPAEAITQPAPRLPESRPATGEKPPAHERGGLDRLAARRTHQIAEHVNAARQALDALQYEDALEACGKALWLDPQDRDARDLQERAQGALDEQKIQGWLDEARQLLSGEQVHDAQLTAASGLIDEAIAVNPVHETATALRREVLGLRRQRELDRDDARHVHAVLARARENLELEEFDACIAGCDDALTVSSGSAEARELRQRAVAARDERRRNREIRQRAEKAVREARAVLPTSIAAPTPTATPTAAPPSRIPEHVEASPQPTADVRRSSRAPVVAAAAVAVLLAGARRVGIVWQTQRHGTKLTDRSLVTATVFRVAPGTSDRRSGPGYGLGNRAGFGREFAATGRFGSTVDSGLDSPDTSRIDSGLDSATRRFRGRSQGQVCCGCGSDKSGKRTRHSPRWNQRRTCSVEADGPATTGRCRHGGERRSAGGRGVQGGICAGAHNRGPITKGHRSTASSVGKTFCREANRRSARRQAAGAGNHERGNDDQGL